MPDTLHTRTAYESDLRLDYQVGAFTTCQLANAAQYAREDITFDHAIAAAILKAVEEIKHRVGDLNRNEGRPFDQAYVTALMVEALDDFIAPNHLQVITASIAHETAQSARETV